MRLRLSSKNFYEYCGIYIQGKKICEIPAKPAFIDVLENLSEDEFNVATKNLILMVLHEGALGQVMHFPKTAKKFRIMQLTIPKSIPIKIMRYVIAHEFGHVIQDRNWKKVMVLN